MPAYDKLSEADAFLLLLRSGFQPRLGEIDRMSGTPLAEAAASLVATARTRTVAPTPPPAWTAELPPAEFAKATPERRRELRKPVHDQGELLRAWWMADMLGSDSPLAERMTLFWHGHFTSSLRGAPWPQYLYTQNCLLRREALGNFQRLLHAISRDTAMLYYLNNQQNRKSHPNENFARELLELFTLGEGHYSEQDIRAVARAFTGWHSEALTGRFVFKSGQHDSGSKRIFGREGRFDGDQALDLILEQPRAAEFIVEKLWREFISPSPEPAAVRRLAEGFRRDWEIAPLMSGLLREPALLAPENRGTLVKSPVEFVVGTVRFLGLEPPANFVLRAADRMGQRLMEPPNVRGWPGGDAWITSASLLARRSFLQFLSGDASDLEAGAEAPPMMTQMPPSAAPEQKRDARLRQVSLRLRGQVSEFAEELPVRGVDQRLLAIPPLAPPEDGARPDERLHAWLLDPVYNLK